MSRLYGVKKMLPIAVSTVVLVAGCGGHDRNSAAPSKSSKPAPVKSSCDPADDSCIPSDHPSSTPVPVPAAEIGKPFRYQAGGDNGAITQELTVLKVKAVKSIAYPDEDYTAKPDPGHILLCVEVKLRNVGTMPGDSFLGAQWFGLDGKTVEPAVGSGCDGLGMSDDLTGQPDPQPGKYVTGSTEYQVPAAPGALEITDRDGSPLVRINYGPRSAQVPIDARGQ